MNSPSAFYRTHHAVEEPAIDDAVFRPFWRVVRRTRLDRLFADAAISGVVYQGARRFKAAVEQLIGARRGYDRVTHKYDRPNVGRFDALEYVGRVRTALGPTATALVWSCVIDDASWAGVGHWLGVDPKTARKWTIVALQALASFEQRGV